MANSRGNSRGRPFGQLEALELRELLAFDPSPFEQAYLENINRTRMNPQGELSVIFSSLNPLVARQANVQSAINHFNVDATVLASQWSTLTPVPPLAWNETLSLTAAAHNGQMISHDMQEHQLPGEASLGDRVRAAGYSFRKVTENIYAYAEDVTHGHAGFVVDWGDGPGGIQSPAGHRDNILDRDVIEVGIHVVEESNGFTSVGPQLVTQDFGKPRTAGNPFVLGVVWRDANNNSIYDPGEGIGGVDVTISGPSGTYTTTSMSAGGYQVQVPSGTYQITASGSPLATTYASPPVTVGSSNVKSDFELNTANQAPRTVADTATAPRTGHVAINVLGNDADPDGSLVISTLTIVQAPTEGEITVNPQNGIVTYWPFASTAAADTFFYTVTDNRGAVSARTRVSVARNTGFPPPVANDLQLPVTEDTALTIDLSSAVSAVNSTLDWSTLTIETQPTQGTATVNSTGRSIRYQPTTNYSGGDSLRYRVADNRGVLSNVGVVSLTIAEQNDAPFAVDDRYVVGFGPNGSWSPLSNDTDVDDAITAASVEMVANPRQGTALVSEGQITYTPRTGFVGLDNLTYRARDARGLASVPAQIRVYVLDPSKRWQNPSNRLDVDGNEVVSPLDALLVLNVIGTNLSQSSQVPALANGPTPFVDVNGDSMVSPLDALLVINALPSSNPSLSHVVIAEHLDLAGPRSSNSADREMAVSRWTIPASQSVPLRESIPESRRNRRTFSEMVGSSVPESGHWLTGLAEDLIQSRAARQHRVIRGS
ncbi:MAG TPA: Ig-like domain-containing protein [Pirellulaceae bacterium]